MNKKLYSTPTLTTVPITDANKEQMAYIVLGHTLGSDRVKIVLDGLAALADNMERFALLIGVGLTPESAKITLQGLGYQ